MRGGVDAPLVQPLVCGAFAVGLKSGALAQLPELLSVALSKCVSDGIKTIDDSYSRIIVGPCITIQIHRRSRAIHGHHRGGTLLIAEVRRDVGSTTAGQAIRGVLRVVEGEAVHVQLISHVCGFVRLFEMSAVELR